MTLPNGLGVLSICILGIMLITITPVQADLTTIPLGGDVFIGEQGLKIPVPSGTLLSWYTGTQTPGASPPSATVTVLDANNFYVIPASFVGHTGNWYIGNTNTVAFVVNDPSLDVDVWDQQMQKIVTGKSVPAGDYLNFRIETNLATVPSQRNNTTGFVNIKVKTSDGTLYTTLLQDQTKAIPLAGQSVNAVPFFWINQTSGPYGWSTGILDSQGNRIYKRGVYTFWIESNLNGMMDNYKDPSGNDYAGKTFSWIQVVTLASDTVKIESSKDSVVRGYPFSVTVTGRPNSAYYLWVTNTSDISGKRGDQPPSIMQGQADAITDPIAGPWPIGSYQFQGGNGKTIREDVPQYLDDLQVHGTAYYALFNTSASGTRTIGFVTSHNATEGIYTVRVERPDQYNPPASDSGVNRTFKSDQVEVAIQKGAVTIIAAGDHVNYSAGETIKLTGTDSETDFVYLFITGAGLPQSGGMLMNPHDPVNQSDPSTFSPSEVLEDNTWSIIWPTGGINLSAGAYTIYAAATPTDKNHLNSTEYGSVTITITSDSTNPTITPTVTPTTVIPTSLPTTAPITFPTTSNIGGGWRTNLIPTTVTQKPTMTIPTTQIPTVTVTAIPLTPTPTPTPTTKPSPWDIPFPKIPLWSGTLPKISFGWIPF